MAGNHSLMNRARRMFNPPALAKESEARIASLLNFILWGGIAASVLHLLLSVLFLPDPRLNLEIDLVSLPFYGIALVLLHRGRIRAAALVFLLSIWGLVTITNISYGGIHSPGLEAYLLLVLVSGMVLRTKEAAAFAGLGILTVTLMLLAEGGPVDFSSPEFMIWVSQSFYFLGALVLVHIGSRTIRSAVERAREKEGELGRALAQLEDQFHQRIKTEEALGESERRYRALFDRSTDGIFILSLQGEHLAANHMGAALLGYRPEELAGKPLSFTIKPDELAGALERIQALLQDGTQPIDERTLIAKDGTEVPVEINLTLVRDDSGRPLHVQSIVRDVSRRKHAEAERLRLFQEVEMGRERLRVLSNRLVEMQEAERQFLSRELHDEIGQQLTGLTLLLGTSQKLSEGAMREKLAEAQAIVNELMRQVRELSLNLRPAVLDDFGLVSALGWLFERFTAQTGIRVHQGLDALADARFPPELETAVYRIVQEALTNTARHAMVDEVFVSGEVLENQLSVSVEDRGVGMRLDAMKDDRRSSGLTGMRERAALLGGRLVIDSNEREGTRIRAVFPFLPVSEALARESH